MSATKSKVIKVVKLSKLKYKKILNDLDFDKKHMDSDDFDELQANVMNVAYDPDYEFKKLTFYIPITDPQYSKQFRLEQQLLDMGYSNQAPYNYYT